MTLARQSGHGTPWRIEPHKGAAINIPHFIQRLLTIGWAMIHRLVIV